MTEIKTFCLFAGRHVIPGNPDAICSGFDFNSGTVQYTEEFMRWIETQDELSKELDLDQPNPIIRIYVTGLTPALIEVFLFLRYKGHYNIMLMHYNIETKKYWEQNFTL